MTYSTASIPLPEPAPATQPAATTYSASGGLAAFLARNNLSLAFTSYQSGKLYLLGRNPDGGLHVHERLFSHAMGLAVSGHTLLLATHYQIVRFENVLDPGQFINDRHDACLVPKATMITGAVDLHDVGLLEDGRPVFVNTLYNCLAVPGERKSFTPIWKPPFISRIVREDRCHLNGLAMSDCRPAYVTAVSRSDTIDGWRDRRADGGIVMDVASGEIVARALSMPHSPRLHEGKLWLLNSGTGELGWIDRDASPDAAFKPLAFCPGFVRGLAFHGRYAIVGLSRPRHQRFEGLALDKRLADADSEPWCGIQIIDLNDGRCVEWFRIDGAIGELYDVATLPGIAAPMALGFASEEIMSFVTHDQL